jgi:hypothetical protein
MINPVSVIQMLGERHEFIKNHPELKPFIVRTFQEPMPIGTEIELAVKEPNGEKHTLVIQVQEEDLPLLTKVQEILKQAK